MVEILLVYFIIHAKDLFGENVHSLQQKRKWKSELKGSGC
jgi:hypothetical protein